MSKTLASILLSFGCVALASGGLAQSSGHDIEWPSNLPSPGTFGRTVAGDLSGDRIKDAVVLTDGLLIYLFDPHVHSSVSQIVLDDPLTPVTDIDMIPDKQTTPAVLVCAQGNDLVTVEWDGQAFDDQVVFSTGTPINVVRAVDLDQDSDWDFVGLRDGDTVFLAVQDSNGSYSAGANFKPPVTGISQLEVLDWDSSSPAIALLHSAGVSVYDQTGTLIDDFPNPVDTTGLTMAVVGARNLFDRIALHTASENPTEELIWTLASDPLLVEGPIDLVFNSTSYEPMSKIVAMVGCDHDNGDKDDLVVFHQESKQAVVFSNDTPASPAISEEPSAAVNYASGSLVGSPTQWAWPVSAELNRDGRRDLLIPVQDEEKFAVRLGRFFAPDESPSLSLPPVISSMQHCCGDSELVVNVEFDSPSAQTTHINVVTWERLLPDDELEEEALENLLFTVDLGQDVFEGTLSKEVSIPVPACVAGPSPFFVYLEIRLVKAVEVATNEWAIQRVVSPTLVGVLGEEGDLDSIHGTEEFVSNQCQPGIGSGYVVGIVPYVELPPFTGGVTPIVPEPVK